MEWPTEKITAEKKNTVLVSVVTAFITTFMGSALNLSIPSIGEEFQAGASRVGWTVTIYMLACTALAVPFGRMADMAERKRILASGIFLFCTGSLSGASARSLSALLIFRFLQGVGASMIFSTNVAMVSDAAEKEERGKLLGYTTAANYLGLSAGPAVGGLLNDSFGWRSVFLAAAAVSAAAFFIAVKKLPSEKRTGFLRKTYPSGADCVLYVCGISGIMWGMSSAVRNPFGIGALAAGTVCLTALFFGKKGWHYSHTSLLDLRLFRNKSAFLWTGFAGFFSYGAIFAMNYLLSLYLQLLVGCSSRRAGLILIAAPVMQTLLSPVMGRLSDRRSPGILSALGMALTAAVLAASGLLQEETSVWFTAGLLAVSGVGCALFASPNTSAAMSAAGKDAAGMASAALATMRSAGHTASMAVVTMLTSLFLGPGSLAQAEPSVLLQIMHMAFLLFSGLCILGIFMALKGKV